MRVLNRTKIYAAFGYFCILSIVFFPFVWGRANILSAAREIPSIYVNGALGNSPSLGGMLLLDPVGSGATVEPAQALEHEQIFSEHLPPLWNPDIAFGTPFAAEMAAGALCPFNVFTIVNPSPVADAWYVIARLFCAGFFTFLFLRFFMNAIAAFIGGIAFMLSGYFMLFITMPHLSVECLFGLSFFTAERLLRKHTLQNVAIVSASVAISCYGGFPESTVLVVVLTTAYVIARVWYGIDLEVGRARSLVSYVVGVCLGIGSAALLVVPFIEFMNHSWSTHPAVAADAAFRGLIDVDDGVERIIGSYLVPLSLGPLWSGFSSSETSFSGLRGYVGTSVCYLAVMGLLTAIESRERSVSKLLVYFAAAGAFVMVGKRFGFGLVNWIGMLPILRQIAFSKYGEPSIEFCFAILCAFGVAAMQRRSITPLRWNACNLIILTTLTIWYFWTSHVFRTFVSDPDYVFSFTLSFLAFLATALLARPRAITSMGGTSRQMAALACVLVVELATAYFIPTFFVQHIQPNRATNPYTGAPYISFLKSVVRPGERVYASDIFMWPNWAEAFGLRDIRANEPILDEDYYPFLRSFLPATDCNLASAFTGCTFSETNRVGNERLLSLAGVRYIATTQELPWREFTLLYNRDARVYRFEGNSERARLYHDVQVEPTIATVRARLQAPGWDVTKTALLEANQLEGASKITKLPASTRSFAARDRIGLVSETSQELTFLADSASPSLFVLADTYYPGWEATIDGHFVPTVRVDALFRGIFLTNGSHVVKFVYRPRSYAIGLAISLLCVIFILTAVTLERRANAHRKSFAGLPQ